MQDILAIILLFGGGTIVALAMSPIGRAMAARIQGQGPPAHPDDLLEVRESYEALKGELEAVRLDVNELQERVDFAERLLARKREEPILPPVSDRP